MERMYSLKYWDNRIYLAAAMTGIFVWSCAKWKAEDRYYIGPDPTRAPQEELSKPTITPQEPEDLENAGYTPEERREIEKELPTSFIKALPPEEVVEARWQPIIDPEAKGLVFAIEDLVWIEDDKPAVIV